MKIPTYLDDKENVIILKQQIVVNESKLDVVDNVISFTGNKTVFVYIEDYANKSVNFKLDSDSDIQLYMIFKSSIARDYELHFNLDKQAKLDVFSTIRNVEKVNISLKREFHLKENAYAKLTNALLTMGHVLVDDNVSLDGEFATCDIDVLNIGSFNDVFTINQDVIHNAKSTTSNINNSLISHSNSKLDYSVSGRIYKGNEYSSCKQQNKGIILDESGVIGVEPKLFIDEYNVEASHGAAIGQMDDEQLYYLLSRGLTEQEARSLIISGYTKPFINNIMDEDIKLMIERQILKRINEVDIV